MNYKITVRRTMKSQKKAHLITLEMWGEPATWGRRMNESVSYGASDEIIDGGLGISLARKGTSRRLHKMEVCRFNLMVAAVTVYRIQKIMGAKADIDTVIDEILEGRDRCITK